MRLPTYGLLRASLKSPSVSIGQAKHILKAEDVLVVADSSTNVVYRTTPSQVPRLDVQEAADRIMSVARLLKTTGEKGTVVTDDQWAQLHQDLESRVRVMSSRITELTEEVRRLTEETNTSRKELKTAHGKIQAFLSRT
jgi:hypothetical protein